MVLLKKNKILNNKYLININHRFYYLTFLQFHKKRKLNLFIYNKLKFKNEFQRFQ